MCRAVENLVEKYGKQYEEIGEKRGTAREKKATALRMLNSRKYTLNEIADYLWALNRRDQDSSDKTAKIILIAERERLSISAMHKDLEAFFK